ncbi:MAG: hypothetical protein GVY10_02105 [Verrucomicrobia bacterium]|jgi:hypothetical protein|nr:hypothetical protein [Verrucomicrobiota bacterium]
MKPRPPLRSVALAFALALGTATAPAVEVGEEVPSGGTTLELEGAPGLHLVVEERKVVAHFLDAQGNALLPPADSIIFVVDDPGHRNDDFRTVLRAGNDASLTGPRNLYPPYSFRVRLIIRMEEGEPVILSNEKVDLDPAAESP